MSLCSELLVDAMGSLLGLASVTMRLAFQRHHGPGEVSIEGGELNSDAEMETNL